MKLRSVYIFCSVALGCVSCDGDVGARSSSSPSKVGGVSGQPQAGRYSPVSHHHHIPKDESVAATAARIATMRSGAFADFRLGFFDHFSIDPLTTGMRLHAVASELAKDHPILALDLTEGFQKYPGIKELAQELSRSLVNERFAELSTHLKGHSGSVPDALIRLFSKSIAETDESRRREYYQLIEGISADQAVDKDGLSLRRRYMEPLLMSETIQDPAVLARLLSPGKGALELQPYIARLMHAQHFEEPRQGFTWIASLDLPAEEHNATVVSSIERLGQASPAKIVELLNDPEFIKSSFKLDPKAEAGAAAVEENRLYDAALAGFLEVTVGLSPDAVEESAGSFSSEALRQDFKKLAAGLRAVDTSPE